MARLGLALMAAGSVAALAVPAVGQERANPFAGPSSLPFQAPRFDLIRDGDYQPAFDRFRALILSRGHIQDYDATFRAFYGKDPDIGPMLEDRGLAPAAKPGAG